MKESFRTLYHGDAAGAGTAYGVIESRVDVEGSEYIRYGAFMERGAERVEAPDLYADEESAGELAKKLCQGAVTPVTFFDIVSDELYAREFPA